MDRTLRIDNRPLAESVASALPPEAPMAMPTQSFSTFDKAARRSLTHGEAWFLRGARRTLILGGAGVVAGLAVNQMRLVLNVGGLTVLECVVLGLFALNAVWIALPSLASLVGFLQLSFRRVFRRNPGHSMAKEPLASRTALLVPIFNEDPARVAAAVDAMASDLVALGEGHSFDVFMLSDTSDGDLALREQDVVWALRCRLGEAIGVYYRRRAHNTAHKSSNIREFCERWGGAYDHLLILDADSLMEGATMIELARRMEKDPDAGLIQTIPRLQGGTTLVARMQQFAGRVYGPALAAGLAWWSGREGNFWGHNAIVRTRAFTESAGLPNLPGKPPRGGPILSHDFIEAALMRRAGWSVRIADDLQGSYEGCPASLIDLSLRDRRWCQGNLQHARILAGKGLHWVSRFHLLCGMFAFISSPVWMLFLLAALALGVQNEFARPEYFARGYTLFPLWPYLDPVRALRVFVLTLAILAAPKILGVLSYVCSWKRLRASGGLMFPLSLVLEIVLSALLAPILMLIHCGFVAAILAGKDGGWRPQRRENDRVPWTQVAYRHRWHVVVGILLSFGGLSISWEMLAWLSPAAIGMVAAVPLSLATGSPQLASWARRLRLLQTPEETRPPGIRHKMEEAHPFYEDVVARTSDLLGVVVDSKRLRRHLALTDRPLPRLKESIHAVEATADVKIRTSDSLEDALACLTAQERAYVQSVPDLLLQLSCLPLRSAS